MSHQVKICVVGAGIIGISTAVCIQERLPNVQVTVLAEAFSPHLTSDIAAGHIEPYVAPAAQKELIIKWTEETMRYIEDYMKRHPNGGAQEYSGYLFTRNETKAPYWAGVMKNFRQLSEEEVRQRHPLPQKAGFFFSSQYLEPTKHIAHLTARFHANGGKCVTRRLGKLSEVGEEFAVVVNCTGIGAHFLLDDKELVPVRGQIVKVHAPFLKHFFVDDDYYALLNDDCVILGGTRDSGEWDTSVNPETAAAILEGNQKNIPSLKDARVLSHHVGLRPYRSKVRLEAEEMDFGGRIQAVVHNYGHGGSGVTIFWGCAVEATRMVKEQLRRAKL